MPAPNLIQGATFRSVSTSPLGQQIYRTDGRWDQVLTEKN
jgi:hypothetical protein